jgi:hypothetical protein
MSRSASHASVWAAYAVIDVLAVLFGYEILGERTLEEFYQRLQPFAVPFMALFERERLPSRSALSRFVAALTEAPVEALRTLLTSRSRESPTRPCLHREANRRPGGSRRKHLGGL